MNRFYGLGVSSRIQFQTFHVRRSGMQSSRHRSLYSLCWTACQLLHVCLCRQSRFYWAEHSFLINCFRSSSFRPSNSSHMLTSPMTVLGSNIYLTSWVSGTVAFLLVQSVWRYWTRCFASDFHGKGKQLQRLAFEECAEVRKANLFKHSDSESSKGIQYAWGVWGVVALKPHKYLDCSWQLNLDAYPLDPIETDSFMLGGILCTELFSFIGASGCEW